MATRLHGWGYSMENNTRFDVYLDDGAPDTGGVQVDVVDLKYNYKFDQKDIDAHLLLSNAEVTFLVDAANASHESALQDMVEAEEGQFRLRVERGGILDYVGFVLADLLTVEDTSGKYQFTIKATDGVAKLKTIEYTGGGAFYDDYATIIDHLKVIMAAVPSADYFAAGAPYLEINTSLWPAGLTPSNTDDPLELVRCSYRAFRLVGSRGEIEFSSYYDVLLEICQAFGLRFMHSRGRYLLTDTIDYSRAQANATFRRYDVAGNRLANATVAYSAWTKQASSNAAWNNNTSQLITYAGGKISYLPALRSVAWSYQHYSKQNTIPTASEWTHQTSPIVRIQNFRTAPGLQIALRANATARVIPPTGETIGPTDSLHVVLGFRLYTNDDGTFTSLSRFATVTAAGVSYSEAEWVDGLAGISAQVAIRPGDFTSFIEVLTPEVPSDGDLSLQFFLISVLKNGVQWAGADAEWRVWSPFMETLINGSVDDQYNFSNFTANNTGFANNSATIERTARLGDGPTENSFGRFEYFDGTIWRVTDGWQKWAAGSYIDSTPELHGSRRSADILFLQNTRRSVFTRTMRIRDYAAEYMLLQGAIRFLLYQGTADLLEDTWSGKWKEIKYFRSGSPEPDEVPSDENPAGDGGIVPDTTGPTGTGTVGNPRDLTPPGLLAPGLNSVTTGLDSEIPAGVETETVPVQSTPVEMPLYEGDIVVISNPVTGQQETVTVTYDNELGVPAAAQDGSTPGSFPYYTPTGVVWLVADSTNVAVEGFTPGVAMPEDSFVQFDAAYLTRLRALLRVDHVDANLFGFSESLTTGFHGWFWRPGRRAGWHIRRVHFAFAQAGTGQAKINLKYYDATGFRYTIATHDETAGLGTVQEAAAIVQDGYYRVEVETLSGTPPKGLQVIIEYVKILPS